MFRIVLCDDSPADLMVLCGHLEQLKEKRPVDIISYTDGLDLLKDYKQKGFCDILVLDMRMETMGGIEVAKHIRQLDDEVPILIVTATVDYAVEGYKVGAFRYIVKPVESGDFLSAVEELLDRQQKKQASIFSFPSISGTTKLMTDHIYYLESDLRTIRFQIIDMVGHQLGGDRPYLLSGIGFKDHPCSCKGRHIYIYRHHQLPGRAAPPGRLHPDSQELPGQRKPYL